jgi:hypothetical protein
MAPRPNPKIVAAFTAMKALGIDEAKVKPVLKKLLKLYDKNWELIEEGNYRALVDAIFDEADNFEVFFSLYFLPAHPCGCTHTHTMIFLHTYLYCWILFGRSQNSKKKTRELM